MSFEQDIAAQITASDTLTSVVGGKVTDISTRIWDKEEEVRGFVIENREQPAWMRISKNQRLLGTDQSIPDFWESAGGITYTLVHTVGADTAWVDRPEIEQEILAAMGRHGAGNIHLSFNIWRMDWANMVGSAHTFFQRHNTASATTVAAYTKLLSGEIAYNWAHGATSEWKLTGTYFPQNSNGHLVTHPMRRTPDGSMLFALPAAVSGNVPLDDNIWGLFPYIGDTPDE
ncbi:MAG: hypothetical protein ACI8WB_001727 [Phenylobacterium sp.]|jgi:hypothetical protein